MSLNFSAIAVRERAITLFFILLLVAAANDQQLSHKRWSAPPAPDAIFP